MASSGKARSAERTKVRLCFADTETTGLADTVDEALKRDREVIEYAFAIWEEGAIVKRFSARVMPSDAALPDAKHCASMGWNHFDQADWYRKIGERTYGIAKRWSEEDCAIVHEHLDGETLAGSNPRFDLTMLKAEFARLGALEAFPKLATHRLCDVGQLAWPLWAARLCESTGLASLTKLLGIEHKAHTAMGDVEASIAVFERLIDEYIFRPQALEELARMTASGGALAELPGRGLLG